MVRERPLVRAATAADAEHMARFVEAASEGLVRQFWAVAAEPGEPLLAVGTRRAARDDGAFSWRNTLIAEIGGRVAGGLVSYRLAEVPEPVGEAPPIARPLLELENEALGTRYLNVLATYPEFRRRGVAGALIGAVGRLDDGPVAMSLIVADANAPARALYARLGFLERERRPIVKEGWRTASTTWILMVRPAAQQFGP